MTDPVRKDRPRDTGMICIVMLARLHRVPADIDSLVHRFAPVAKENGVVACGDAELLRAAQSLGFRAGARRFGTGGSRRGDNARYLSRSVGRVFHPDRPG
jgi:ABC-type bacteriocin/lantibiotic exporter with double-glycine peptidase domain